MRIGYVSVFCNIDIDLATFIIQDLILYTTISKVEVGIVVGLHPYRLIRCLIKPQDSFNTQANLAKEVCYVSLSFTARIDPLPHVLSVISFHYSFIEIV